MTRADGATVPTVAFPARLSVTPATYRAAPPALGADTDLVLREHLNLDDATISRLREAGVI
jgi:crotonobetainyl-CoA:carnitine CoA-transferase CaiB-like acyl-CoA transferase